MGDDIAFIEWASLYSKDQVKEYPVEHPLKDIRKNTVLLQDNTSALLKCWLCGQRTRNIHIRCFYGHERVADGTIVVTYCPTKEMVSNYLFKPLQGSLFQTHHNTLMGISTAEDIQHKLAYAKEKA